MRRGAGGGRMMPERRPARLARRIITIAVAGCASALLLGLLAVGFGTAPALGPALVPWHGAWTSAVGGKLPGAQTLTLRGLAHRAEVSFTGQGTAAISATSDNDAFLALGYVHAEFRLAEMDLERRLGAGPLAPPAGPSAVASDKFELRLGLLRTAQQEWAQTPRSSPAAQALIWYSRGVNDYLARARATGQWPALFSLAGVYLADWTPVDSLVIQGDLTQELNFTTTPLDYALLERSLGVQHTMQWFPVLPVSQQSPYDPGPSRNLGIAPITASGTLLTAARKPPARAGPAARPVSAPEARAAASLLAQVSALPAGQVHGYPDSNAWAAPGPARAGAGAGRPDGIGGLDGQHPRTRPGRHVRGQQGRQLRAVPLGTGQLACPHPELRLRRRPGQHRRDLGRLLPAGTPWSAMAPDAGNWRRRCGRRHPVRRDPAELRPARSCAGDSQSAAGRKRLSVLHRHDGQRFRSRLPGQRGVRLPAGAPLGAAVRFRCAADEPD